jgi:uncharacterized protein YbjQ (UPF0145 family)
MSNNDDEDDFSEKGDLTRIDDLESYEHLDDDNIDDQLEIGGKDDDQESPPGFSNVDELDDAESNNENSDDLGIFDQEEQESEEQWPDGPEASEELSDSSEFGQETTEPQFELTEDEFENDNDILSEETPSEDSFIIEDDLTVEDASEEEEEVDETNSFPDIDSHDDHQVEEQTLSEIVDENFQENTELQDTTFQDEQESFQSPDVIQETAAPTSPPPEDFQDIRDFAGSITYGKMAMGGSPPYSVMLKDIKFKEDAEDILTILREHDLVKDDNENIIRGSLENGQVLISQIGEYSAIYLAHKFRRFDVSIQVGLSEELHPSKSYQSNDRGLVSRFNLVQNRAEEGDLKHREFKHEEIILSTMPTVEGHHIHKYIDILTSHKIIDEEELKRLHQEEKLLHKDKEEELLLGAYSNEDEDELNEMKEELQFLGVNEIYKDLAEELRNEAYKREANAIIGLNYQITPLVGETSNELRTFYKITCTGNAVWVETLHTS